MKACTSLILFLLLPFLLLSQGSIQGRLNHSQTGEGIEAVHVFIANTTIGTFSDQQGNFLLQDIPLGKQQIIFSHISFEQQIKVVHFEKEQAYQLNVDFNPVSQELNTIEVSAKSDKKWRRQLKKFSNTFLGKTVNAKKCQILNPTVLQFSNGPGGQFIATASDLLEIENRGTGYRVFFLLEHFQLKGEELSYAGKPFFEELTPANQEEKRNWDLARKKTYLGSKPHFFKALINHQLKEEGFLVYTARQDESGGLINTGNPSSKTLSGQGQDDLEKIISFDQFLRIIYLNEKDDLSPVTSSNGIMGGPMGQAAEREMITQETRQGVKGKKQVSYLFARKNLISVDTAGFLLQPESIAEYGYWNYERIAELLPREYLPVKSTKAIKKPLPMASQASTKKGFILDRLLVPLSEIRDGGPPKDGIPSIDYPKFLAADEADFISDEDLVLGVFYNGIASAYPISILNYHEIVNDEFGNQPVVITYCPLCASGLVFLAGTKASPLIFGVSGLLYNSDVLLYDRESESLWSQLLGKAISGQRSGTRLEVIPSEQTTWAAWRKRYPETMVLSTNTTYTRDYTKSPYTAYTKNDQIMFPVTKENKSLPNKEKVLGVEVKGVFKAFPFDRLRKLKAPIKVQINGEEILIHFDQKSNSARATDIDGAAYPSTTLYWFAWYAFHPTTTLWK